MTKNRSYNRHGLSLVEMIVAMTVGAALMGIAVTTLHVLMRAETRGESRMAESASIMRLAEQFRRDVHAAIGRLDDAKAGTWRLDMGDGRVVEYTAGPGKVVRRQWTKERADCEESFSLPEECAATITGNNHTRQPVVCLLVAPARGSLSAARELRIEAVLGRDHRFEAMGERSK
jgi:prepilin-type N-terminal cleavage/methylation domain-containing protein